MTLYPQSEANVRCNRLQVFIVRQNRYTKTLQGATIFIKKSHKHLDLFHSYLRLTSNFTPYSCPTFMKSFNLDVFNDHLK